ncbi:acyl carrier protein [Jiangella alkaliphila]|uniref:Acyl carrier protein n=1 Tax=Jiangella alkaliphila TaxID=419479 RepID=A0A1H2I6B2_9ACTN|nr:phosphopantetheine-binding protein [Jiangella alkaliphila]SDU39673.1 acyl carrier protein [Jiangella alkaliphila]
MTNEEIFLAVRPAVAEALGLDEDEVTPDATLLDELGAESIDLLDILFRLERSTGVKIQAADLSHHVQGGIPDEEFGDEANDVITPVGMEQLKKVMPQIAGMDLDGKLQPEKVMSYFTVQNLTDLVAARAAAVSA